MQGSGACQWKACRVSEERPADVAKVGEHPQYIEFFMDGAARFRTAIAAIGPVL